jgi:O-antigen ligase
MPTSVALQLGGLVVVLATLAATGSRMGAVVGCLGVGSVSALMLYQHRVALWRIGLGTLAGLLVLIAGAVLSGQSVTVERLFFALAEGEARPELFRQTWQMIAANPWWGYGVDSYPLAFELYRSEGLRPDLTWQAPHNTYLTLWVEYGVGFGSVTLLLVATLLYWAVQGLNGAERDILPAAIATAVIALTAVHALVDFSLEIAANTYLFVALVALGLPSGARGDA